MTDFPEGGSFRASSTSSLDPMGDWLASADDPFLASSSTVLPNRMESRTGYSPLSMGREEFRPMKHMMGRGLARVNHLSANRQHTSNSLVLIQDQHPLQAMRPSSGR
ncbi:hypothetical protein LTR74_014364 [Friedmanniomyces endolithicus]|nr:hypothetical protein LTR74_014364 [Friedmanniomyces endolithicus]